MGLGAGGRPGAPAGETQGEPPGGRPDAGARILAGGSPQAGPDRISHTISHSLPGLIAEPTGARSSGAPWRALLLFAGLACLFSWVLWSPLVLRGAGRQGEGALDYLHLAGSLGPALAALLTARLAGGPEGLRRLMQRIRFWRAGTGWHAVAWLGPFAVLAAAHGLALWSGAPLAAPDPAVSATTGANLLARSAEYPGLPVWLYWLAVLVFYGFGEEIGWRGYALPLLQSRWRPPLATLVLTLVWALWHAPLFLFSPGLAGLDGLGMAGWLASLLTGACLLTLLFNGAGGSVPVVAGFHAAMDIAFLGPPEVMMLVGAITTLAGAAALVFLLVRARNETATGPPPAPPA